ncbi:MAG TPA: ABC transporter ATP-binding protein [Candidatus Limnocylindrales bacterium]|nr:ABC transporter ATP-binding protein [Candidatus Limnocylindrales bacterium]
MRHPAPAKSAAAGSAAAADRPFLSVENLAVSFPTEDGLVQAVDGVSLTLERGKTLAIVGESGSGKSVTAQAIMGLVDRKRAKVTGEIWLDGQELVGMPQQDVQELMGSQVAMIFQDPLSSLHPFYRIGDQISEAIRVHRKIPASQARKETLEMLRRVGIPAAERRIDAYPHQLSGGMRQRVMIAMALINSPALLIADEPTTALDVTVQAQILELIANLQAEFGTTVILITHDLGIVADVADEVAVMYGGRIVERAGTGVIYPRPEMPYTLGLLSSVPRMDRELGERLSPIRGNPPSPINLPKGCVFQPRCDYWEQVPGGKCLDVRPDLLASEPGHLVRCHLTHEQRLHISSTVLRILAGDTTVEPPAATASGGQA